MPGHAALYTIHGPPPVPLVRKLPGVLNIRVDQPAGEPPTQYRFEVGSTRITINALPADQVAAHLNGFCGYVQHLHANRPSPHTGPLVARIRAVKTVLGCVIDPDWDDDGLVSEALFTLNQAQAGVLFALDTVFDSDGTPLVGPLATDSA